MSNTLPGISIMIKDDGSTVYRASVTYNRKHISLGTYKTEDDGNRAYLDARELLDNDISLDEAISRDWFLPVGRVISLLNFKDNGIYSKSPIYLRTGFINYYFSATDYYIFSTDDLFYYSNHKIIRRGGYLYVNDYGSQINLLHRYGIKSYAVKNRDYRFINGDDHDFRYENIEVLSRYHGVKPIYVNQSLEYAVYLHVNGNVHIGTYSTEERAAIAYNKAADHAKTLGIKKNFPVNYVQEISPKEYAEIYTKIHLPERFLNYEEKREDQGNSI